MKTKILILFMFLISLGMDSADTSGNLSPENNSEVTLYRVYHFSGNGEYIELHVPLEAWLIHLSHGDSLTGPCTEPPCGG